MRIIDELRASLKFTPCDEKNIEQLIEDGRHRVMSYVGEFDPDENLSGRILIKEYVRFAWNGVSEHFYDSFKSDILNLRWQIINDEPPDEAGDVND